MNNMFTSFQNLSGDRSLRYDFDYHKYYKKHGSDYYSFNDLFEFPARSKIELSKLEEDFLYCEIGDVEKSGDINPVLLNFSQRHLEQENYYKKIEKGDIISVDPDDILLAKVRPNLKKYILITETTKDTYFTSAFIRIHPKKMPRILYHCLRSIFFDDIIALSRQGKGYPTLTETDLATLKFNKRIIDHLLSKEDAIEIKINEINEMIVKKKSSTCSPQQIIDSVFQKAFGYDHETFERLKQRKIFHSNSKAFSNNPDLRFSAKFHRPAGDFVMSELTRNTDKKIKHFLAEPIVLGASISPSEFDENGHAYYLSMATIKTLEIELDDTQLVSDTYYEKKKTNKSVQLHDIIIARSGVAIGKTAIVMDNINGIFADFTMRVRIDPTKYDPIFAYYYMRTKFFQYLIEINKKGLQNQNIFPTILKEFPVPDISLYEQTKIVEEIQEKISRQDIIKNEIDRLRHQIDKIILQAINT